MAIISVHGGAGGLKRGAATFTITKSRGISIYKATQRYCIGSLRHVTTASTPNPSQHSIDQTLHVRPKTQDASNQRSYILNHLDQPIKKADIPSQVSLKEGASAEQLDAYVPTSPYCM